MSQEILAPLQFLVLSLLSNGDWNSGSALRTALAANGHQKSRAAFSNLIVRLEAAGLIKSEDIPGDQPSHLIAPRRYQITDHGRAMLRATLHVYELARRQIPSTELSRLAFDCPQVGS